MERKQLWRVRVECLVMLFLLGTWLVSVLDEAMAYIGSSAGPVATCEMAVQSDPNNPKAYFDLARAYHQANDLQAAIPSYEQALRLDAEYFEAYVCLASCYRQSNMPEEAKKTWQRAFERYPERAWRYLYLARADYGLGEDEQALADWEQATVLRPDVAWPYMFLGRAYERRQRPDKAQTWYEKARQVDPSVAAWFFRQADELCGQQRWQDAIEFYSLGLKAEPDASRGHLALGKLYLRIDDKASALEEYRALKGTDRESARELVRCIHEQYPDCLDVYLHLARIHSDQQDYEEAVSALTEAIRISPDRADSHVRLGEALYHLGSYEEAVKSYHKAIWLEPKVVQTHLLLAKAHVASGADGLAINSLKRALELDRDGPQVHYELGRFYLHVKNEALAVEQYRQLRRLDDKLADELQTEIRDFAERPARAEIAEEQLESLGRLKTIGFDANGGSVAYFERLSTPVRTGQTVYGFKAQVLSNEVRFTRDGMEWVRKLSQ
jgi:tetratricopeptide (TPR) repeat protein